MSDIRLVPTPYVIESLINADHWDWPKGYAEFIDNSFGASAGRATKVTITIGRSETTIEDNGIGIEQLQQCFRLGDSTSRHSASDIGRYGVGAKHAAVWMGKRYYVTTVRDGACKMFHVDWDAVRRGKQWPEYKPAQRKVKASNGTKTTIKGFWPQRKRLTLDFLVRSLSETFAPALEDGKTIMIIDKRPRSGPVTKALEPWKPKGWSDCVAFKGEVGGRSYTAEIGILSDHYSSDSGLRICFAHRVLNRITRLDGHALPVRIFGYVRLSDQWKDRLATNKTEIVDAEDLEKHLFERPEVQRLIAEAEEYQQEILLEGIVPRVELFFNEAIRRADDGAERLKGTRSGTRRTTPKPPQEPPEVKDDEPGEEPGEKISEPDKGTGLRIKIQPLGAKTIGQVEESDDALTVVINKDCPLCKDALNEATAHPQGHYPALFSVIGSILSIHARQHGDAWLRGRLRIGMPETNITDVERFFNWWFFRVAAGVVEERPLPK